MEPLTGQSRRSAGRRGPLPSPEFLEALERERAAVTWSRALWQSLQVCSEAEKRCNKQVPPSPIAPPILPYKCSALLALLSVKSPSSCLTLLRQHDRHPCHLKCLQHSDAPNLSCRQVNLWIIYFYVLSKDVDSSQKHPAHTHRVQGTGSGSSSSHC